MPTYFGNYGVTCLPPGMPHHLAAEYLRQAQLPPYEPTEKWTTKDGQPIRMEFLPMDPEDTRGVNKGYVVRRVNAYVSDTHAGYLKISYVPSERVPECYPTLWHWFTAIKGWCFDAGDLRACWEKAHGYAMKVPVSLQGKGYAANGLRDAMATVEDMQSDLKALEDTYIFSMNSTPREAFEEFIQRSVDHAFVDFIRVFKGKTKFGQNGPTEINWQRQGIGTALYIEGARWMGKTYNLPLHGSGLQNEDARAAWDALRQRFPVSESTPDGGKVLPVLDYREKNRTVPTRDGPRTRP